MSFVFFQFITQVSKFLFKQTVSTKRSLKQTGVTKCNCIGNQSVSSIVHIVAPLRLADFSKTDRRYINWQVNYASLYIGNNHFNPFR